ncbi:MAG TPA: hypothetical protein DEO83_06460 [Lachnospiraceae bacterium]|nr:hypothetical protein [Lachnospiraceae bacterium]
MGEKNRLTKGMSIILALVMIISLAIPKINSDAASKKIKLSSSKETMTVGATKTLTLKKGSKKIKKSVKWKSSNKKVAKVSSKGKIIAKKKGTVTITATYKKKKYKCKITVKAKGSSTSVKTTPTPAKTTPEPTATATPTATPTPEPVYSLSHTEDVTMDSGDSYQLYVLEDDEELTEGVTWSSSDEKIATVDKNGLVTGQSDGDATITAQAKGKKFTCTFTINGFNPETDMTITPGTRTDYIEFVINKNRITAEELEKQGYTISSDKSKASMNVTSETATYSFKRLPKTLEEIKMIPLDSKFGPLAATICAISTYTQDRYVSAQALSLSGPYGSNGEKITFNAAFEYLNGPTNNIANDKCQNMLVTLNNNFGYSTNTVQGSPYMFFKGANDENNYTPDEPYEFTLWEGPYYIPAKKSTIAYPKGEPEKRMIFVKPEGSDSERYLDTYYSKTDKCWYSWAEQCQHFVAGMKESYSVDW